MKISIHIHSEYSSDSRRQCPRLSRRAGGWPDTIACRPQYRRRQSGTLEMKPDDMSVIIGRVQHGRDISDLFIDDRRKLSVKSSRFGAVTILMRSRKVRARGGLLFQYSLHSTIKISFIASTDETATQAITTKTEATRQNTGRVSG